MREVYSIENLGCAHCGAKIEDKIKKIPGIQKASLTFATKKLEIEVEESRDRSKELTKVANGIESGVIIKKEETSRKYTQNASTLRENRTAFLQVIGGAFLFVIGFFVKHNSETLSMVLFLIAYLILGFKIIVKAVKNIVKGQVFDENFLMSIATIAAAVIGDYAEAAGVMLFYRVGELFEDMAVKQSRNQIMETVDLRPEIVAQVHGEHEHEISAQDAKVGDIILVKPGDRIPLDGVVIEGNSRVDTSPVTGEPVPVGVSPGEPVISGCVNEQGVLKVQVQKVLADSMVSRILNSVEQAAANKPKMDRFITRFSKIYTPIVVLIAILTALIPSFVTGNWNHWVYTAITFLVISCPCALVLSVPLTFFSGIGAASKAGVLFKGGLAIEGISDVKAVMMDKTGTLTTGTFAVRKIVSITRLTEKQILTMAANSEQYSTHPIAASILLEANKKGLSLIKPRQVEEIRGKGIKAIFPEGELLTGNEALMVAEGVDLTTYRQEVGSVVMVALNKTLLGWIVIDDTIKSDAKEAVKQMKHLGLHTGILTGDGHEAARAVGEQVSVNVVFSKLLPEEKLTKLEEVRDNYGNVMFIGDGINDAPVLAGADVGGAMGSGADAAIEAADVVFMNNTVNAIPYSIEIARATKRIAKQNVIFALTIKALVMLLGFMGMANMWLAVFADTGVSMLCVLNSIRILRWKKIS